LRRIAWHIARSGLCSRRDAEALIAQGRVKLEGKVVSSPALSLETAHNITVDHKPLKNIQHTRLWLYHKPIGLITTFSDPFKRATICKDLAKLNTRVITVGRLDKDSEGLLLLTNSGDLARHLTLPQNRITRSYEVMAQGMLNQSRLAEIAKGATIKGVSYRPATFCPMANKPNWYRVELTEGKNREIRRMIGYCGAKVVKLIRTAFGSFTLENLKVGEIREVKNFRLKCE